MTGLRERPTGTLRGSKIVTSPLRGARRMGRGAAEGGRALRARSWSAVTADPRRTLRVLALLTVVLVLASVAFVLLAQRRDSVDAARSAALATAQDDVAALLSYDYRSVPDDIPDRAARLTGDMKTQYVDYIRDVVAPKVARDRTVARANVSSAGVIDNDGTDTVRVLMFINQTTKDAAAQDPTLGGSRVRVTMHQDNGSWLVSEITPV